jgi:hypothetical protein
MKLGTPAVIAGYFLVCLLAGGTLLDYLLRGTPRETTSSAVAVIVPTFEAPAPVAATPKAVVPDGDASVTAAAQAEPASAALASRSPDLAVKQAAEEPERATEPAAPRSPVIVSMPRAGEIGSAGKDAIYAASAPPWPFVRMPAIEAANTVSGAEAQIIPAAPAVSAPPTTLPDPVPQALAPRMTPPVPTNGAAELMASVSEIIANVAPAPAPPTVEPPASVEVAVMVARGYQLLGAGDIISARRFFERAAASGDAAAACGVGKSFDPLFLRQVGARGLSGDAATAMVWYRKAAEAGSREAQGRLRRLSLGQQELSIQNRW